MFHNSRSKSRGYARKRPVQQRSRDTVDTILTAAARVLEQRGYAGFNTNRVAERAGVSIGSVYQYFPDKDALLAALGIQNVEQTERALVAELGALRARNAAPRSFARGLIRVWCSTHDEAQHALMYAIHSGLPGLRPRAEQAVARFAAEVSAQLRGWGVKRPALRARASVLAAITLVHELIIAQPHGPKRKRAEDEAVAMLTAYFEATLPPR
ncbi:MAG TPA: TetR/AcrR family transcriptional regulator [Polyangiales bacterium]